jgi:hypothetical protein
MESWRRAWKGSGVPVAPYEDTEWVAQRREFLASLPSEPPRTDRRRGSSVSRTDTGGDRQESGMILVPALLTLSGLRPLRYSGHWSERS